MTNFNIDDPRIEKKTKEWIVRHPHPDTQASGAALVMADLLCAGLNAKEIENIFLHHPVGLIFKNAQQGFKAAFCECYVEHSDNYRKKAAKEDEIKPSTIAAEIHNTGRILFDPIHRSFFMWSHNRWRSLDDQEMRIFITQKYGLHYSPLFVEEVVKRCKTLCVKSNEHDEYGVKWDKDVNENNIYFSNCVYDIYTRETNKHSSSNYNTFTLPASYNKDAPPPAETLAFLSEILPDPDVQTLIQQIFGVALSFQAPRLQQIYFFIGSGSNGKSQLQDILRSMLGHKNVSAVKFSDFSQQHVVGSIEGKLANISQENEFLGAAGTEFLKGACDGSTITINNKYVKPYEITPHCTFIFNTNESPRVRDTTYAWLRRMVLIDFPVDIPVSKRITKLGETLWKKEKDGIVKWALDGLEAVIANGWKTIQPARVVHNREVYSVDNDTIECFLRDRCVPHPSAIVNIDFLYDIYTNYVHRFNYKTMTRRNFISRMCASSAKPKVARIVITEKIHADEETRARAALLPALRPPAALHGLSVLDGVTLKTDKPSYGAPYGNAEVEQDEMIRRIDAELEQQGDGGANKDFLEDD